MIPISSVGTGAVQPLTTAEKVLEASKAPKSEEEHRQLKPVTDEYIPEEPLKPSGRYWMSKDEDGQPKIYFDDPERAADVLKQPESAPKVEKPDPAGQDAGPERKKDEVWEGNSDKVDREIEKLKKKKEELEQRLNIEADETKIKALERQLAQVKRELKQKDSDTYRRQHTTVRQLS